MANIDCCCLLSKMRLSFAKYAVWSFLCAFVVLIVIKYRQENDNGKV